MTFYVLDPNLKHLNGHHLPWDMSLANAARDQNIAPILVVHRDFEGFQPEGVAVIPHFRSATYDSLGGSGLTKLVDDHQYFNKEILSSLNDIDKKRFGRGDVVLVPTCTQNHLLGFVQWMKSFPAKDAPTFVVHLLFPPSCLEATADSSYVKLLYQLAFTAAIEAGPDIHFFGAGDEICERYNEFSQQTIFPFPIPVQTIYSAKLQQRDATILFVGDAKIDKGFLLLPQICEQLCPAFPERDFLLHANVSEMRGAELEAARGLFALPARHENLSVYDGWLDQNSYAELWGRADSILLPYSPQAYATKTSGILWEALGAGLAIALPDKTWCAREAERLGAGICSFEEHSVADVAGCMRELLSEVSVYKAKSHEAAHAFAARNGAPATIRQIFEQWPANTQLCGPNEERRLSASEALLHYSSHGKDLSHLDLSLFELVSNGAFWPCVKFKFCVNKHERMLEFRRGSGWPDYLRDWGSAQEDEYGQVIRLSDVGHFSKSLETWSDPHDLQLLSAIIELLPRAVHYVVEQSLETQAASQYWLTHAIALTTHLRDPVRARQLSRV